MRFVGEGEIFDDDCKTIEICYGREGGSCAAHFEERGSKEFRGETARESSWPPMIPRLHGRHSRATPFSRQSSKDYAIRKPGGL